MMLSQLSDTGKTQYLCNNQTLKAKKVSVKLALRTFCFHTVEIVGHFQLSTNKMPVLSNEMKLQPDKNEKKSRLPNLICRI